MSSQSDRLQRVRAEIESDSAELAYRLIYEWVKTGVCGYSEFLDLLNVVVYGAKR